MKSVKGVQEIELLFLLTTILKIVIYNELKLRKRLLFPVLTL